jgi:thiamine-monophosphate kinase
MAAAGQPAKVLRQVWVAVSNPQGEFELIARIRRDAASHPRLALGIGDDAAALTFPRDSSALVTVDMLMEGVDFLFPQATPPQVGRKALAVNLSDIAAMAGRPVGCVVSVALPRKGGFELACGLYEGISALAREFDVAIAGGDTNTWEGPLVISITVLGDPTGTGPVCRAGARPGDWIMATGSFGGSRAGKQFSFTPRVHEAIALHAAVALHAMIDVSDGLAADLGHILEESRVGAVLDESSIPVSPAATAAAASDGRSPLEHALSDGEDFELLFTVSPEEGQRLLDTPPFETPLSKIGQIVSGTGCLLKSRAGKLEPLPALGWKHGFE